MGGPRRAPGPRRPKGPAGRKRRCYEGRWGPLVAEVWIGGGWLPPSPTRWLVREAGGWVPYLDPRMGDDVPKPFTQGEAPAQALKGAVKGDLAKKLPELMSWVCDATFEDGTPLQRTSLQFERQGSMIRARLKIQDQGGLVLEVVDASPERAMASLEAMLNSSPVPWQVDRFPLGGEAGNKKKR